MAHELTADRPTPTIAPYGSWRSPISAAQVAAKTTWLGYVALHGSEALWVEMRPHEGGRQVIVRRGPDGERRDLNPPPFNARTRVHEYGGTPYLATDAALCFVNFADQQLYTLDAAGGEPRCLTDEPGHRFADLTFDAGRERLIAVREDHTVGQGLPAEVANTIAAVPLGGGPSRVLVEGNDFYAAPRLSPDGARLLWLTWNHPNMPWDGTELWLGELAPDGSVAGERLLAGGPQEAIASPLWLDDGSIVFASDRSGWWALYRWQEGDERPIHPPMEADFARPMWQLGVNSYGPIAPGRLLCSYTVAGRDALATLDLDSGRLSPIELPFDTIRDVATGPGRALLLASSPRAPSSVVALDVASGEWGVLAQGGEMTLSDEMLSLPVDVEFPTSGDRTAYGFLYRPTNGAFAAPAGMKPPLIVRAHGGPTGFSAPAFSLATQYWTSRGFAVLDVNYGGSVGYGRAYRERLRGQWGIVDLDDCEAGARWLVEQGEVDPHRLAITGGSAGGYTVLAMLTFRDRFHAGASHYGVSDLALLAEETHKFESHYLEGLIGPFPERRDRYDARSPLHHTERLQHPLILFQGLEDRVVPPAQAEAIHRAARDQGVTVAYLPFEGEQHGFRRAETIQRVLEAELSFYAHCFDLDLPEPLPPIPLENG